MVIQRWQTVFLFIGVIFMSIFSVSPMATLIGDIDGVNVLIPYHATVYFILNILIAVLLLISIFLFKRLDKQKLVILVSLMLMVVSAVCGYFIIYGFLPANPVETVKLSYSWILLLGAFVMGIVAYRCIVKDERLIRSYDRLR